MEKSYIVLPIGQYPFSKEYVNERATSLMNYGLAKEKLDDLSKAYPNVTFVLFQSLIEQTYKPEIKEHK